MTNQLRQKLRLAVYVIFKNKTGEILLIRRKNTGWRDGEYTIPAGNVDPGETALQACVHEAREEVGLEISADDLKLVHVAQLERTRAEDDNFIYLFFDCEKWRGDAVIGEPEKSDDLVWLAPKNFDQVPVIDVVRGVIEKIERGENLSFYGF